MRSTQMLEKSGHLRMGAEFLAAMSVAVPLSLGFKGQGGDRADPARPTQARPSTTRLGALGAGHDGTRNAHRVSGFGICVISQHDWQ